MSEVICACLGMTKEQIINEVKTTGTTQAGSICGACQEDVDKIVSEIK